MKEWWHRVLSSIAVYLSEVVWTEGGGLTNAMLHIDVRRIIVHELSYVSIFLTSHPVVRRKVHFTVTHHVLMRATQRRLQLHSHKIIRGGKKKALKLYALRQDCVHCVCIISHMHTDNSSHSIKGTKKNKVAKHRLEKLWKTVTTLEYFLHTQTGKRQIGDLIYTYILHSLLTIYDKSTMSVLSVHTPLPLLWDAVQVLLVRAASSPAVE